MTVGNERSEGLCTIQSRVGEIFFSYSLWLLLRLYHGNSRHWFLQSSANIPMSITVTDSDDIQCVFSSSFQGGYSSLFIPFSDVEGDCNLTSVTSIQIYYRFDVENNTSMFYYGAQYVNFS